MSIGDIGEDAIAWLSAEDAAELRRLVAGHAHVKIPAELRGGIAAAAASSGAGWEQWFRLQHVNLVYGVRAWNWSSTTPIPPMAWGGRRLVVPYQFSGLSTSPGDHPRPKVPDGRGDRWWEGIFEAFYNFLRLVLALPRLAWEVFAQQVLGTGTPDSMTRAWQPLQVLEPKKNEIELQAAWQNPKIPTDILPLRAVNIRQLGQAVPDVRPDQAGAGIWVETDSGRIGQLFDPNRQMSPLMNQGSDAHAGWLVPWDAVRLHFTWLSRDHRRNDGDSYGSFTIWEERLPTEAPSTPDERTRR